eukprot:CAMPEP_0194402760 /NCGR_PEP_ID=MMETSP0176-20130528/1411_1 /TAXON_ID=216777 /ORGANISM="Proboscia alata, Strain PI-D3" /LENGTH=482 /DNA_ID=CAMNT_0039200255 /DNA_START=30 /DNA_END=1478 /DNA_ORIENTATION=-
MRLSPIITAVSALWVNHAVAQAEDSTIVEIVQMDQNLSTLVSLVVAAGLAEELSSAGPFTLFAPTNDAFANLPDGVGPFLNSDVDALRDVLLYHVVNGTILSKDVAPGVVMTTLEGSNLTINSDYDIGNEDLDMFAELTNVDIIASNGVIHVIEDVVVPLAVFQKYVDVNPGNCSLCPGGESVPDPDFEIPFGEGITCGFYESFASTISNDTECAEAQMGLAGICGCTSAPVGVCSSLCPDGEDLPNPDLEIPILDGLTCGVYESTLMASITNETECAMAQLFGGAMCECPGSDSQMCTVCPNSEMLYPDNIYNETTGQTCAEYEDTILSLDPMTCYLLSAFSSAFGFNPCGCGTSIPSSMIGVTLPPAVSPSAKTTFPPSGSPIAKVTEISSPSPSSSPIAKVTEISNPSPSSSPIAKKTEKSDPPTDSPIAMIAEISNQPTGSSLIGENVEAKGITSDCLIVKSLLIFPVISVFFLSWTL